MTMELMPERVVRKPVGTQLPGPRAAEIVARDDRVMSPSYTRSYPFVMAKGRGTIVWDPDGNEFIDMTSGIAVTATGHSHPDVVRAIQDQAERFIHMSGTDFYYEVEVRLAERLAALAPGDEPKRIFFTNSGTEAVEGAMKLARHYTGRQLLLAFTGSFHGRSLGSLSLTASKPIQRARFGPLVPGVFHVPFPDPYRPTFGVPPSEVSERVLEYIERTLFTGPVPADEVAAVFVEPVLGEGGYVVPPADFLPGLRDLCDRHGILLVADEIQSGVGRTGRWWAVDHTSVVPDIVTSAKGIASGMPLGAIIASERLMAWPPGAHGNTFGGNPISCAAALATLDVIEQEGLLANAQHMGRSLLDGLGQMAERYDAIGDVRGVGLMVAIDLVTNRDTRQHDAELRDRVIERAFGNRLLLLGTGKSAVRLMPPLNVSQVEVDRVLELLDRSLSEAVE